MLSVQYGKRLLGGDAGALASLKEELEILRSSKQSLLVSAGFPEDYLEPVYTARTAKIPDISGIRNATASEKR